MAYRTHPGRLLVLACVLARPGWAGEQAPSSSELLRQLASDNADQRDQAARLICEVAPGDKDVLTGVTGLLGHKNPAVRLAAARLLGGLVVGDGQCVRGRESRRKASSRLHGSASEKAVRAALDWLARFQDHSADGTNGRWDPSGFAKHAEGQAIDGAGDSRYEVGVTGLALLAFLGGGYTDRDERYGDAVRDGLAFLMASQAENGCCGPQDLARRSTNHAVATLALCEAWILTGDPKYRQPAQKAVTFLEQSHSPEKAWGYVHDTHSPPDTHTTGWVLVTLGIARRGGLSVEESSFRAGLGWFTAMESDDPFRIVGYDIRGAPVCYGGWGPPRKPRTSRGAYPAPPIPNPLAGTRAGLLLDPDRHALRHGAHVLALWCRLLLDPSSRSQVPGASGSASGTPFDLAYDWPSWRNDGDADACLWAYSALVLAQVARPAIAGKETVSWFKKLHDVVLPKQRKDGAASGSWDPVDAWGVAGGRIYSTAMIARALEAPYLYGSFGESTVAVRSTIAALHRISSEEGALGEAAREALALIERAR